MYGLEEIECHVAVISPWPEPHQDGTGPPIDCPHQLYLGVSLRDIMLIDAQRVNPKFDRPSHLTEMGKGDEEVLRNRHGLAVDPNRLWVSGVSLYV